MNPHLLGRLSHLRIDKRNLNTKSFTHTGVYDIAQVEIMKEVASDLGIEITILATEGETYTSEFGFSSTVRHGYVYVKMYTTERSNTETFWVEVKRLSSL
jgi:hypothetical protein